MSEFPQRSAAVIRPGNPWTASPALYVHSFLVLAAYWAAWRTAQPGPFAVCYGILSGILLLVDACVCIMTLGGMVKAALGALPLRWLLGGVTFLGGFLACMGMLALVGISPMMFLSGRFFRGLLDFSLVGRAPFSGALNSLSVLVSGLGMALIYALASFQISLVLLFFSERKIRAHEFFRPLLRDGVTRAEELHRLPPDLPGAKSFEKADDRPTSPRAGGASSPAGHCASCGRELLSTANRCLYCGGRPVSRPSTPVAICTSATDKSELAVGAALRELKDDTLEKSRALVLDVGPARLLSILANRNLAPAVLAGALRAARLGARLFPAEQEPLLIRAVARLTSDSRYIDDDPRLELPRFLMDAHARRMLLAWPRGALAWGSDGSIWVVLPGEKLLRRPLAGAWQTVAGLDAPRTMAVANHIWVADLWDVKVFATDGTRLGNIGKRHWAPMAVVSAGAEMWAVVCDSENGQFQLVRRGLPGSPTMSDAPLPLPNDHCAVALGPGNQPLTAPLAVAVNGAGSAVKVDLEQVWLHPAGCPPVVLDLPIAPMHVVAASDDGFWFASGCRVIGTDARGSLRADHVLPAGVDAFAVAPDGQLWCLLRTRQLARMVPAGNAPEIILLPLPKPSENGMPD